MMRDDNNESGPEFGVELKAEQLKTGPTMDVAVDGDYVFAIGRSELRILEHGSAAKPFVIGRLHGLGNTRQIAVSRGYAYITAREDGLFLSTYASLQSQSWYITTIRPSCDGDCRFWRCCCDRKQVRWC